MPFLPFRDRSQTLVRGGPDAKNIYCKNFSAPPSDRKKISGPPPFLPWKLRVNPIEKHVNSIFNGKSAVIFSGPSLQGSKILRPPFCIRPPLQVFVNSPLWEEVLFSLTKGALDNFNILLFSFKRKKRFLYYYHVYTWPKVVIDFSFMISVNRYKLI